VAYRLIYLVLCVLLAVLCLSLPLRLPWLDPRLPWLALRPPWLAVLWAPQKARLACGRDLQSHQKVLRAHHVGSALHPVLLHRKKVLSVPRWAPPAAPLRTSDRSWRLHRLAPGHNSNRTGRFLRRAPCRTPGRSLGLHRGVVRHSSGKMALVVLGYALGSMRSSLLPLGYFSHAYIPMRARLRHIS
jgi:hypothetical protein